MSESEGLSQSLSLRPSISVESDPIFWKTINTYLFQKPFPAKRRGGVHPKNCWGEDRMHHHMGSPPRRQAFSWLGGSGSKASSCRSFISQNSLRKVCLWRSFSQLNWCCKEGRASSGILKKSPHAFKKASRTWTAQSVPEQNVPRDIMVLAPVSASLSSDKMRHHATWSLKKNEIAKC